MRPKIKCYDPLFRNGEPRRLVMTQENSNNDVMLPPGKRPTIADVARAAGVTKATVSMILNDRPECFASEATRTRVYDMVKKLGYRPSAVARALNGKPTLTIGLIVTGLDVEVTSRKIVGFESSARAAGLPTMITCTENNSEKEDQAIQWLMDRQVDAIAIYPSETGPHNQLRRLVDTGFPVVTFDGRGRLDFKTDDVSANVFKAGQMQAEHLLELGRTRLAYVAGKTRCYVNDQKIEGFQDVFKKNGMPVPPTVTIDLDRYSMNHYATDEVEQVREHFLTGELPWDAIAAVGDAIAMGVIRIATEMGVSVPDQLAVVGCDGMATSAEGAIPLTTITHDSENIGVKAYQLLRERLSGERSGTNLVQLMIQPTLQVRRSTVKSANRVSLRPV